MYIKTFTAPLRELWTPDGDTYPYDTKSVDLCNGTVAQRALKLSKIFIRLFQSLHEDAQEADCLAFRVLAAI